MTLNYKHESKPLSFRIFRPAQVSKTLRNHQHLTCNENKIDLFKTTQHNRSKASAMENDGLLVSRNADHGLPGHEL